MLLNEPVPKAKDPIEQRKWINKVPISFDFQRPLAARGRGNKFNTCRALNDRVSDENCFYLRSVLSLVRSTSMFCGVRYDIADRKVGILPTHLVLESGKVVHAKMFVQHLLMLAPDPIGHVPCRNREIDRRVYLIRQALSVRFGIFEPLLFTAHFSKYVVC